MALAITGTGNGSLNNLALSANTGTIVDTARAGGVLQVVQATTTTQVTVATTTFTDTTLTASITPNSSSNKVLVMVNQQFKSSRGVISHGIGIRILRDSTVIWTPIQNQNGPYGWYIDQVAVAYQYNYLTVLDSPSTTSSVTYKTQGRPHLTSNSGQVIFQLNDTSLTPNLNSISTIILMEVAG